MTTQTILITGSGGEIGTGLRTALARSGRRLRLLDIADQPPVDEGEEAEIITGSFTDIDLMIEACAGVDAVVHLGSLLDGASWPEYSEVNITGTYVVLEAARRTGVPRVIYASSHHAVGFGPSRPGEITRDYAFPRPDSFYGVTKVASEALCSLYYDRHGIESLCVRIGSYRPIPNDRRCLWNWLSPGDMARIIEAGLSAQDLGYRVIWGISGNRRRRMSLDEACVVGYVPADDAERWAEEILASTEADDPIAAYDHNVGALFTPPEFDSQARTGS